MPRPRLGASDRLQTKGRRCVRRGRLLAQAVGETWYFLPGGHVEPGEPAAIALRRELAEELGVERVRIGGVLAIVETGYTDPRGGHHEVNLVHRVAVSAEIHGSREEHIRFEWRERSELHELEIKPTPIAELLRAGLGGPEIEVRTHGLG